MVILWLALHSARIIARASSRSSSACRDRSARPLSWSAPSTSISIAFAVLFIGLGVDFGIQFSVRYREERYHELDDLQGALRNTATTSARS